MNLTSIVFAIYFYFRGRTLQVVSLWKVGYLQTTDTVVRSFNIRQVNERSTDFNKDLLLRFSVGLLRFPGCNHGEDFLEWEVK